VQLIVGFTRVNKSLIEIADSLQSGVFVQFYNNYNSNLQVIQHLKITNQSGVLYLHVITNTLPGCAHAISRSTIKSSLKMSKISGYYTIT